MFSTFKQKLLLGVYVFILLSIPVGAYLASQQQNISSSAKEQKNNKPTVQTPKKTITSPAKGLLNASAARSETTSSPSPSSSPDTILPTSYGPTLSLKAVLEGRPKNNQATRLFVGILEGALTANPKFLLNFTIDLPASGEYSGLSLAGLTVGSRYTALLKGSAQIATESAFTMSPNITNLNEGQPVNLISGDLNDDNIVNSADYSIVQKALGSIPKSSNWNGNADLNKDELINTFDLGLVSKNIGRAGASGAWVSPVPRLASSSASLSAPSVGGPQGSTDGYWIWVPK
ncbi:hypothetical protein HYU95_05660 [Candidatus Daviesbacteria bacterium]|nr:hypothetical protein [Candidatus Daviesbacteria bacterium]